MKIINLLGYDAKVVINDILTDIVIPSDMDCSEDMSEVVTDSGEKTGIYRYNVPPIVSGTMYLLKGGSSFPFEEHGHRIWPQNPDGDIVLGPSGPNQYGTPFEGGSRSVGGSVTLPDYMKIFNGTPHAINVVSGSSFDPSIRKYTGGSVLFSIPSNGMLNAKIAITAINSIDGIPVFSKQFSGVDPLPDGFDIYIVSALYSGAAQKQGVDLSKIYTVADPVYTYDGATVIGCRGICPAF